MHQLSRTRRLLVAVPTALLAVSLVGCGDIAENAAEDALEDEGIKADIDGSDIKIDTTDGGVVTGELPKDFPIDEVPVVDGEILFGTYTKSSKTWDTTVEVGPAGGDKQAAYDEAEAKLLDAGATVVQEPIDNGSAIGGQYTNGGHTIDLAVTDTNGIIVNYLVSPAS
jgi:hypothetical protein